MNFSSKNLSPSSRDKFIFKLLFNSACDMSSSLIMNHILLNNFGFHNWSFLPILIKDAIEDTMKFKINRHALNFYGQCLDEENCSKKNY